MKPHVSFQQNEDEEEEDTEEDLRTKQVHELEMLQKVIDENNALRAKYNALQTQVAPIIDSYAPTVAGAQYQNERQITPEEVENYKNQLEATLSEYRKMTQLAGKLNQQLERQYTHLSDLKMQSRIQQDEKINHQNQISSSGIAAFRSKTERVKEQWNIERQRLTKSIAFLKNIHDSSIADVKEYEEQMRTNNKGIMHLSSSITVAKEDIREFLKQQEEIEPKLKQFEELQEKHQNSEILVVELSDQIEELRKKVETDSLTAKVRRQLDTGNAKIADLNRSIDQIQDQATAILEKVKETKNRISELDARCEQIHFNTLDILDLIKKLEVQRKEIKEELTKCFQVNEMSGGENLVLEKEVSDGVGFDPQSTSTIRKQMLTLKGELLELDEYQQKQIELANNLKVAQSPGITLPTRKRVPMIPLLK
ncbi:hypothetical protein TRFO_30274 [Tritrichomonas foetus]|uniref:Uncharacterized protein n=1 Tax=Tritrichomonas foetus TaxID=1144522 RepID=A0A1J4JU70_9EUKA|nr:hypothetical protein TRFO_30274 [Tritrichomonas foetus]|eukprot:OHT02547.1 hypothetical protein TRFO_30274 [Tritrichomonas foetus]